MGALGGLAGALLYNWLEKRWFNVTEGSWGWWGIFVVIGLALAAVEYFLWGKLRLFSIVSAFLTNGIRYYLQR